MNYSRRQLEALGEPLGECVTRREGGRIIYGGGGGSAPPATQTQVAELPDWAKPYAQETLEKTKALTAAPYQAYGAPRIAGFSPLQEQAQQAAAGMRPSELGQFGGQVAGAASLGALGTQYNPFRMGQFTAGRAAQYMNPFVEMAMEPQLREAQRSSEMQKMADQAQAVRSGAFGGSRQAIVEAERQRNLGMQQGDIRAKGYTSAFDQAQQQFAREQQLREQSRQFGAGLGMQGFQTALQGAGQLGALGGQQFGQEMDINRLQQQVGAQQQALRQQGLTQAYQDFLNEQNYPYKQLGFMSDMIRGLPLGQQSTRQLYEPPGSMLGQLGGLGMGLYGLSQMGARFNEGGQVDGYAEGGGVDDPDNVAKIVGGLSDAQLAQAKQAAQARGDFEQLQAITVEEGMRASERSGLAGAFNQLPYERQEEMMAGGGVVAFSNGGPTPEEIEAARRPYVGHPMFRRPPGKQYEETNFLQRFGRFLVPPTYAVDRPAESTTSRDAAFNQAAIAQDAAGASVQTSRRAGSARERTRPAERPAQRPTASAAAPTTTAISALAKQLDVPEKSLMDEFKEIRKSISEENATRLDAYAKAVEKATGGSKEVKEQALGAALAEFGFKWAASAAKPGARFLSSAAEAGPTLAASMAQSTKLAREMDQNDQRLRLGLEQLRLAEANNDSRTAMQLTAQVRALQQSQQENALRKSALDEQIRSNTAKEGIMRSRAAAAGPAAAARASASVMRDYAAAQRDAKNRAQRRADKDFAAAMLSPELQKYYKDRGITTPAQLYQQYVQEEMRDLSKGFVSNVAPDEDEDET